MNRYLLGILAAMLTLVASCGGGGGNPIRLPIDGGDAVGIISGTVTFTNTPPEGATVWVAVVAPNTGIPYVDKLVPTSAVEAGSYAYTFTNIDFGTYGVAVAFIIEGPPTMFYGPADVTVSPNNPYATGVNFTVEFTEEQPATGSISGTVTFIGEFPAGAPVYIGASVQLAEAPAGFIQVNADDLVGGAVAYSLPDLPLNTYYVSIFTYDMATHRPTYFGSYASTVALSEAAAHATGIDFDADTSLLE